jgi:hypothetical protein
MASVAGNALTPESVLTSFKQQVAPLGVLGKLLDSLQPTIELKTVTETTPIVPDVQPGSAYQAWVVTYHGAPAVPAPAQAGAVTCTFTGIMKVSGEWTDFFEDCPPAN